MRMIIALIMISALLLMTGCEATKGLGRDIEKAGEWVQDKAD